MPDLPWRLFLVADAPSLGENLIFDVLGRVLPDVPPGSTVVLDRDRPPSSGGPTDRSRLERLERLRALTRQAGAGLLVSARADLAVAAGADGVQLPERGHDAETLRRVFPELLVGRSCHDGAGLARAAAAGAHWAFLSPVWTPLTPHPTEPRLGPARFGELARDAGLPVVALGGVTGERAPTLRAAGAAGVATLGAVFQAAAPAREAQRLLAPWRHESS